MEELKDFTKAEIETMGDDDLINVSDNLTKLKKLEDSCFIPPILTQVHVLLDQIAGLHKKSNEIKAQGFTFLQDQHLVRLDIKLHKIKNKQDLLLQLINNTKVNDYINNVSIGLIKELKIMHKLKIKEKLNDYYYELVTIIIADIENLMKYKMENSTYIKELLFICNKYQQKIKDNVLYIEKQKLTPGSQVSLSIFA
jgi:hypothetical protein